MTRRSQNKRLLMMARKRNLGLYPSIYKPNERLLALTLTVMMLFGVLMPASTFVARAEDPIPYGISLDRTSVNFGSETVGYDELAEEIIKITNEGTENTGELSIEFIDGDTDDFILSTNTILNIGTPTSLPNFDTFTVRPETGLDEGDYSATGTVAGGNGIIATFTVSFTVSAVPPTKITTAEITVTAPVTGDTPVTTASGTGNFTVGTVTWEPTVATKFLGSQAYTATVTLTADSGYTFEDISTGSGLTINGNNATIENNTGAALTISYQFTATDAKTVTGVAIQAQPTKLGYVDGENLDLTGLVVTLTYNDDSTANIALAAFGANGITTSPVDGTTLAIGAHNGQPVTVTCNSIDAATSNLTITAAAVPVTGVTLNVNTLSMTVGGGTETLTATVSPATATNQSVTWLSSNTAAATVTAGVVTAVGAGTATITVTTVDGSFTDTCSVTVSVPVDAKAITSFALAGAAGTINETAGTIAVTVPFGTDVTSLTPTIVHSGAGISPTGAQDFTDPVVYTVTAVDSSEKEYTVTVTIAAQTPPGGGTGTPPTTPPPVPEVPADETATITLEEAQEGAEERVGITLELSGALINIDPDTLEYLADLAEELEGPITVEVTHVPTKDLSNMQAAQSKGYATVVSINVFVGEEKVNIPLTVSLPYTLKAGENPNGVRVWYMDENGNMINLQGIYNAATGMITFTIVHQSYFVVGYDPVALWTNFFRDLSARDIYHDSIAFLNQRGIINGYGNDNVGSLDTLSRAQFATMLWNLEGKPVPAGGVTFGDVPETAWFRNAVIWAAENGIMGSISGGSFNPEGTVTRQQVASFLYNYAVNYKGYTLPVNLDSGRFTDLNQIVAWDETEAKRLAESGVLGTGGLFRPGANITRGEAAELFRNFIRFIVD